MDTSAILAVVLDEPEQVEFSLLMERADKLFVSAVSVLEASLVMEGRYGAKSSERLDLFLYETAIEIVPFGRQQLTIARAAFRTYGKGRHPAGLNFGDCASYSLAKWLSEPLLFKGNDFSQTDVSSARLG